MDPNGIFGGFSGITPEGLRVLQEHFVDLQSMEHIRHGGQGVVFRAVERNTGRTVAVKLLLNGPLATPHQRARFEREVELIGRLRHPNIVTLYGSGEVQGRLYFTMEFVDGHTIDDYALLHDLTPHEIVRLMIKVCRAINYSHQNGIIHRDLTPNNILVDAEGEPRIFDFGLAKDLHAENTSLTEHVVGTLPFMRSTRGPISTRSA
jgi:serine/threonine protein kinase